MRQAKASEKNQAQDSKDLAVIDWLKVIIGAIVIAFLLTEFVFSATNVEGKSMEETLQDGDRLFVWKLGVSGDSLERGDIIVFQSPDNPEVDYIKRVIAFPGEYVQVEEGLVYVNGKRLDEPYINTAFTHTFFDEEWLVGEDELFVLGDNRLEGASRDSRAFGPIKKDTVIGVAFFRFYPWNQIGFL